MTDQEKKKLHLDTITKHKKYVKEMCDLMGIPEQGEQHDLSKLYSDELAIYKYADGKQSPHDNARAILGYSPSWCLHKARNPHHWEYWTDFNEAKPNGDGTFTIICKPVKMPYKYVIEMFCDFVGAGKAYDKGEWTTNTPLDYYKKKCEGQRAMHPDSEELLRNLLKGLADYNTIEEFAEWYNDYKSDLEYVYNKDMENIYD